MLRYFSLLLRVVWVLGVALALADNIGATVRTPAIIGDGMVIQREAPARIWGRAEPGESVTVRFRGKTYTATTSEAGDWEVTLDALRHGGPFTLEIEGENRLRFEDVWVGDVWVASGQSNMELPMERVKEKYADVIVRSKNRQIRHFGVDTNYDFDGPRDDVQGSGWRVANPEDVLQFSAVGYFFAAALHEHLEVPIGIVNASVGGSPLQSWLSEEALENYPAELAEAKRWRNKDLVEQTEANNAKIYESWDAQANTTDVGVNSPIPWYEPGFTPKAWKTMMLPGNWDEKGLEPMNGVVWFRRTFDVPASMAGKEGMLYLGTIVDADETYLNGVKVGATTYQYPPRRYHVPEGLLKPTGNVLVIRAFSHAGRGQFTPDKPFDLVVGGKSINLLGEWQYKVGAVLQERPPTTFIRWKPMGLYNAMIAPLTQMQIKGVIWYQGESNTGKPDSYAELMETLVNDWRDKWEEPELPFIWVQLANFMEAEEAPSDSGWARLRDQQRLALRIPHTGMAVAIDVGEWNDIHPLDKKTVGERLALEARRVAYGDKDLVSAGPLVEKAQRDGPRVRIRFKNVGGGLVAKGGGSELRHFAVAGEDGAFVRAKARIVGDEVEVWTDGIEQPAMVRYAWASNPESANLYNEEGLPASPFEVGVE